VALQHYTSLDDVLKKQESDANKQNVTPSKQNLYYMLMQITFDITT
jgi:hypothetical protein